MVKNEVNNSVNNLLVRIENDPEAALEYMISNGLKLTKRDVNSNYARIDAVIKNLTHDIGSWKIDDERMYRLIDFLQVVPYQFQDYELMEKICFLFEEDRDVSLVNPYCLDDFLNNMDKYSSFFSNWCMGHKINRSDVVKYYSKITDVLKKLVQRKDYDALYILEACGKNYEFQDYELMALMIRMIGEEDDFWDDFYEYIIPENEDDFLKLRRKYQQEVILYRENVLGEWL